ncbi:T9SS type A sorting domain-containing protein [Polaribacter sejongensis]
MMQASSITNNVVVKIFNVYGKEVFKKTNTPKQIDVSSLSNGVYLVQMISGDKKINKKIIITNQ